MFSFNNNHIFTGYLKQLLSSTYIPNCKIYKKEYAEYCAKNGKEDPRVLESFDTQGVYRGASRITYLKNKELLTYFWQDPKNPSDNKPAWKRGTKLQYIDNSFIPGLTRVLKSAGDTYDIKTHEYLGEFLRFVRDYYDVNLMSMYNCFSNKIINNLFLRIDPQKEVQAGNSPCPKIEFSSYDPRYRIYAIPVKLFENYTIAIDCAQSIELFCGFYGTVLDLSDKKGDNRSLELIKATYRKYNYTRFRQPFLYDALDIKNWTTEDAVTAVHRKNQLTEKKFLKSSEVTRWDIANREQDLKLFIKVPSTCTSSIVILEGDYRGYNDYLYVPAPIKVGGKAGVTWNYIQNKWINNFQDSETTYSFPVVIPAQNEGEEDRIVNDSGPYVNMNIPDINERPFKPIGKLQLLALNTGESYPFADRLVEYLVGSAITSEDEIKDNIKRVQKVMNQNGHFFTLDGIWEPKMQKILYDAAVVSGPIVAQKIQVDRVVDGKPAKVEKVILVDKRQGKHPKLGHNRKSDVYDILGYADRDLERWYASWKLAPTKHSPHSQVSTIIDTIKDVDIYNGLYDI
jgi:hypothetical protein